MTDVRILSTSSTGRSQPSVPDIAVEILAKQSPEVHFALRDGGQLCARCSVWTTGTPTLEGEATAVLGHYAARDAGSGVRVLRAALADIRGRGIHRAIGPMDGNTWRSYRFVTSRGGPPPFFLEPQNPSEWPDHFAAAGYKPLATYVSNLNEDLTTIDPRVAEALARFEAAGVVIRPIFLDRLDDELRAVHRLSLEAFSNNFLYTPLDEAEFVGSYAALRPHLRPELILMAEQSGELIGFMFGLPDLAQAARGERIDTAIAKTLAVRPGRSGAGLGSVLIDAFHLRAREAGYTRVIHALMHEGNRSRQIANRYGRPMRQYTLYSQETGA